MIFLSTNPGMKGDFSSRVCVNEDYANAIKAETRSECITFHPSLPAISFLKKKNCPFMIYAETFVYSEKRARLEKRRVNKGKEGKQPHVEIWFIECKNE